jgi:hypothetical protein
VALIGGMVLHAYIGSERDITRAETVKADVQKQIADLRSDLKDTLSAIQKDREQVKTPAQVAQAVPRYTPDVRPILVIPNGVPTQPSSVPTVTLADAPSQVKAGSLVIAAEQVPAYWASVTKCAEDSARLGVCEKQVPLITQRAEVAEKAMHGGGFWSRLKTASKYLAIGGAVGSRGRSCGTRR